jgi:hypothetical protein
MAGVISKPGKRYDCTNKVDFQVAYFWLTCLALNSMTQPSGRVCKFLQKYRFILRSSPVICDMDSLAVLVLWIAHRFWHLEGPGNGASKFARARFRDATDRPEEESLTSLKGEYLVLGCGVHSGRSPTGCQDVRTSEDPMDKGRRRSMLGVMGCNEAAVPACLSERINNTDKPESHIEMEETVYAVGRVSCCDELGTIRLVESRADLRPNLPPACDSILWH